MLLGAVGEREERRKGFSLCSTGQPCWCPVPRQPSKPNAAGKRGGTRLHCRRETRGGRGRTSNLEPNHGHETIQKMVVIWPRMKKQREIVLMIQHGIEGVLTTSKDGSIQLDTGFCLVVEEKGGGGSGEVKGNL